MLARGLAAVVPAAVVGRRDAGKSASSRWCSSASARRVRFTFNARRARCARVVPRHKVVTEAAVSPLARLGVCGSNRCARAITSAFDGGTTASRARRSPKFERSPWRETADARTEDTHRATRAASRGAATTARATSTGLIAPVHDGSGKPNWIQAVLTAGPFAPGYVGRTNNDTRGIHFPFPFHAANPAYPPRLEPIAAADTRSILTSPRSFTAQADLFGASARRGGGPDGAPRRPAFHRANLVFPARTVANARFHVKSNVGAADENRFRETTRARRARVRSRTQYLLLLL